VIRLPTLRGRLAAAMALIFFAALAVSTSFNALTRDHGETEEGLIPEPYQDALVLGVFSLGAIVLIWQVSSWSLKPLRRASVEAQQVGPLNAAARLSRTELPQEIVPLVDAVNAALDRMTEGFEAERRFTTNAAHELRTPLAVLGLRLQRARAAGPDAPIDWPAIDHDLAQMNRLVTQLLDLARKDRGPQPAAREIINLSRAAREAAAGILPLAEAASRPLHVNLPDSMPVRGEAGDLRDALTNLLENALLHGTGQIAITGATQGPEHVVTIADEGPGVPAGQEEAVFDRFQKGTGSEGTGLGLAIVRAVIRGHGGTVTFLPGPPARVAVRLPADV
jgi:two-component system sensor histidine kinase QseC